MSANANEPEVDDEIITCWCGVQGTADELFHDAVYDQRCAGTGSLDCECGGGQCVCHNHGTVECPGCEDCRNHDGDDSYDDRDWDYEDDCGNRYDKDGGMI